jgi:inosine-uridine nucleoside N-ribohydrolase
MVESMASESEPYGAKWNRLGIRGAAWRWMAVLFWMSALAGPAIAAHDLALPSAGVPSVSRRTPIILDTDIGDDIDDTWAIGLLLKSPELDPKLVLGEFGKCEYRAKLIAKFLQTSGRTDIPVGVGVNAGPEGEGGQASWVKDYALDQYPGLLERDGVKAMIDTIMRSRTPVTLICIGPMTNIAAALQREPRIAQRANFVGMDGSVLLGYGGSKTISAEWNIKADVKAAQRVFSAPWKSMTITPLDTCGLVSLEGERYRSVLSSADPIAAEVIENYRIWSNHSADAEAHSTTLYDTVAVSLAIRQDFCHMEQLKLRVTDDGRTVIDPDGHSMSVATSWKDLNGYRDFLVDRLTGK